LLFLFLTVLKQRTLAVKKRAKLMTITPATTTKIILPSKGG
jgi:hypothetical protein